MPCCALSSHDLCNAESPGPGNPAGWYHQGGNVWTCPAHSRFRIAEETLAAAGCHGGFDGERPAPPCPDCAHPESMYFYPFQAAPRFSIRACAGCGKVSGLSAALAALAPSP